MRVRIRDRYTPSFIDSDAGGRILVVDWFLAVQNKDILVHEALHTYLSNINSPLRGEDAEAWVNEMELVCEK